jgi:hypothetical protein
MNCDLSLCSRDADLSTSNHYVYIASFDHDDKVDNSGKAGITFGVPITTVWIAPRLYNNISSYQTSSSINGYIIAVPTSTNSSYTTEYF